MLLTLLRKELLELSRERRIRVAAFVFWALSLVAIANGALHLHRYASLHAEAQAESYHQWLKQGDKNPHAGAHFGVYVFKPVSALALWDKGVDDYYGTSLYLEPHKQTNIEYKPIQDQTALARFGTLWPATVFTLLAPLLMLLLSYNSINRESKGGTLSLLQTAGVSTSVLVSSKLLAVLIAGAVVTVPVFVLAQAVTALSVGSSAYLPSLAAVGVLGLSYGLYHALFAVVGLLCSLLIPNGAGALTAGLVCWMVAGVLIPRGASGLATSVAEPATAFAFYQNVRADMTSGIDGYGDGEQRKKRLEAEVLERYGVDSLAALPVNFVGLSLLASEDFSWRVFDKHFGAVAAAMQAQRTRLGAWSLLSPALAMQLAGQGLSATDMAASLSFSEQAEQHRRRIQTIVNEGYAAAGKGNDRGVVAGEELWGKVPAFEYQFAGFAEVWQLNRGYVLTLVGWLAVLTIGLYAFSSARLKLHGHV